MNGWIKLHRKNIIGEPDRVPIDGMHVESYDGGSRVHMLNGHWIFVEETPEQIDDLIAVECGDKLCAVTDVRETVVSEGCHLFDTSNDARYGGGEITLETLAKQVHRLEFRIDSLSDRTFAVSDNCSPKDGDKPREPSEGYKLLWKAVRDGINDDGYIPMSKGVEALAAAEHEFPGMGGA